MGELEGEEQLRAGEQVDRAMEMTSPTCFAFMALQDLFGKLIYSASLSIAPYGAIVSQPLDKR